MLPYQELARLDKTYLWHPFTQMQDWMSEDIVIIEEGEGCFLRDMSGRTYIDGVSSLWCNVHGHRRHEIDEAIRDQLGKIAHSTFLGLSNIPAILLAQKLISLAPKGLTRVFYSDSGSEGIEIALKMAYQYWQLRGQPEKKKFVKLGLAYHGDTLGAVSVGGIPLFHETYRSLLFETLEAPSPYRYRWPTGDDPEQVKEEALRALAKVLGAHAHEAAALVMEPLMQGAAGMIDQPSGFITEARRLATKYGVLLIFDEVATGFGRTGRMFASHHEGVTPDLMVLAKGLTGGYLPLAATLATEEVYSAFLGEYGEFKAFFHGHTYTANPLACRAALACLEIFEREQTLARLHPKIARLGECLGTVAGLDHVGDVRQVGFMAGIEIVRDKQTKEPYPLELKAGIRVCRRALDKGIWMRPLGNVIVLMPPLAIDETTLTRLVDGMAESIREVTAELEHEESVVRA
jgi:adenosylmethionine-8-amino-7-oxononanoate transaminase